MPKSSNHLFATYYPYYKKKLGTTKFIYSSFLFQSLLKLISLLDISSDCIVKFAIYLLHYKDIIENPTLTFIYVANYFIFLYS